MKKWSVDEQEEKLREIVREEIEKYEEEKKTERMEMVLSGLLLFVGIAGFFCFAFGTVMAIAGILQFLFPELSTPTIAGIAGAIPLTIMMVEYFRIRGGVYGE